MQTRIGVEKDTNAKCLPEINVIFVSPPKPYTDTLNAHHWFYVNIRAFSCQCLIIVTINLIQWSQFSFSSESSHTIRSSDIDEWRIYCWLYTRWENVNGSPIFLFVCCFRFIFHFNALVHLHHGKSKKKKNNQKTWNYEIWFNWSDYFQINGDTILNALKVQVVHYTIQSSLFDIILAAFIRFSLLITFYGIFGFNHWIVIVVGYWL